MGDDGPRLLPPAADRAGTDATLRTVTDAFSTKRPMASENNIQVEPNRPPRVAAGRQTASEQ